MNDLQMRMLHSKKAAPVAVVQVIASFGGDITQKGVQEGTITLQLLQRLMTTMEEAMPRSRWSWLCCCSTPITDLTDNQGALYQFLARYNWQESQQVRGYEHARTVVVNLAQLEHKNNLGQALTRLVPDEPV